VTVAGVNPCHGFFSLVAEVPYVFVDLTADYADTTDVKNHSRRAQRKNHRDCDERFE
jgi:hypothetical protein